MEIAIKITMNTLCSLVSFVIRYALWYPLFNSISIYNTTYMKVLCLL